MTMRDENNNTHHLDRRTFVQMTASGLAASLFMGCRGVSVSGKKPNILFIPVDDLRPELGCYGSTVVRSPNLDRLGREGVVFNNAYCQSAVCNPSQTGRSGQSIDRFGRWYLKAKATEMADVPDNAYFDGAQTDWAVQKLRELKDRNQPFFLAVGYYRPHLPFNAPRKYWDLYDRQSIPLAENGFLPRNAPVMAINNLRELRGYTDFRETPHPFDGRLTGDQTRLLKHGYLASVSYIDAQIAAQGGLECGSAFMMVLYGLESF